jgi:hypothetical protein
MVLEEIYEQDFLSCSYGFRPGRSAHPALRTLQNVLWAKRLYWVLDIDIRKYFDSISHSRLRTFLDQRVTDGVIRRMIDKWLKAGAVEDGFLRRTTEGSPQGGVISPGLSGLWLPGPTFQIGEPDGPDEPVALGPPPDERNVPVGSRSLQHGLLDQSVDDARHAELSDPAVRLGDFDPFDRPRLVGSREQLRPNADAKDYLREHWPSDTLPRATASWLTLISKNFSTGSIMTA